MVTKWDPFDQHLGVWMASQNPHEARLAFSRVTGVPENRIQVQIGDVGGGFGLKSSVGREELTIILAAKILNAAVKWSEDRRENLIASAHAHVELVKATMAVAADGAIVGAVLEHLDDAAAGPRALG